MTASVRSGLACSSNASESLYITDASGSSAVQRRNSANAGSKRPAVRKLVPRLKAEVFYTLPESHQLKIEAPRRIIEALLISSRMRLINRNKLSIRMMASIVIVHSKIMSRRFRVGKNSVATIANRTGASTSIARNQDGTFTV
jgi:hypothetical protein